MKIVDNFKKIVSDFTRASNSTSNIGNQFLRQGNRKTMSQDWSSVLMSDQDIYTGYPYGIINKRANKLAYLAISNLHTDTSKDISTKDAEKGIVHPYLQLIDKSPSFSNFKFWHDISVFLDLEGVYYVMAVRNFENNNDSTRYGDIQDFEMLNPYNIRRVVNARTLELGGYVEHRNGLSREIPKEMIIEIKDLNPFDENDPYSMTDALTNAQFTLRQANDYTRHSLKNNLSAPGAISTDVVLEDQQFSNFVNRITNQEKGMPLFGNGAGSIKWDPMQIEMDKAALDKITDINRSELFAVSGVGKTNLAIEESGTTRETAKVQKDLLTEDHTIPKLQLIIDALNQDYKNKYPKEYEKTGYTIAIQSPLGVDKDSELKDIKVRSDTVALYNSMVDDGYNPEIAAQFINGEIQLKDIGMPQKPVSQKDDKTIIEEDKDDSRPSESGEKNALLIKNSQELIISTIESKLKSLEDKINNKIVINVEKEKKITVDNAEKKAFNKGNPYRDPDGKFTFGPTGSDSSLVSIINTSSTTIQKLNDDLTDLKKDAAGLEQKRFGLDTNSKESKDLEKLHDKNIDLQYETLGKITKARANLKTHVDNYFASEGIEPITLEQKVKQWGDGEWMDSIGPTIAKKPTADMFSKTEVDSMKKLNAQLYPSSVTVYRGMSVSPETKSITFKKNEIVSFSDSKRAAERFGKAKFDDRSLGITISKKIKPSEIIISHKWGSAYSSQVSMNAEIAVSFDAETKIDISKNEFDKSENTAKDLIGPLNTDTVIIRNAVDDDSQSVIETQQGSLQNSIVDIETRLTGSVLTNFNKIENQLSDENEILSQEERDRLVSELTLVLAGFYMLIIPLYARTIANRRLKEFGSSTDFEVNNEVKKYIDQISSQVSESHINTIFTDLYRSITNTYNDIIESQIEKIKDTGRKVTDDDLVLARKTALEGGSRQQIVNSIKDEYKDITANRAKAIARTETNRAFTQAQYQADLQFIKQNGYDGQAYKKWITRSSNPCPTCLDLASQPPIPFTKNFADLGDEIVTTYEDNGKMKVKTQMVDFEPLQAGNAHVNCGCTYQLIIENNVLNNFEKDEKGKFIQHFESDNGVIETVENRGYNPNRDPDGKFGTGPSTNNLPDSIVDKKGTTYYHGTTKENAKSILKNGFDNNLNTKGYAESPYATFISRSNKDDSDHSAGSYGEVILEVKAKKSIIYLDGNSQKWADTMGQSRGVDDSKKWAIQLKKDGYDGIAEANGEIAIWNTDNLEIVGVVDNHFDGQIDNKNYNPNRDKSGKFTTGPSTSNSVDLSNMKHEQQVSYLTDTLYAEYTDAEKAAMNHYTSMTWASAINRYHRTGNSGSLEGITNDEIIAKTQLLDSAMSKLKLPENQALYRITNHVPKNLKVGDTFTDLGYGSTSAVSNLFKPGPDAVTLKIKAPKGLPVINMSMYSLDYSNNIDSQAEILLPRNIKYKIVSIKDNNIEAEVSL